MHAPSKVAARDHVQFLFLDRRRDRSSTVYLHPVGDSTYLSPWTGGDIPLIPAVVGTYTFQLTDGHKQDIAGKRVSVEIYDDTPK